MGETIEDDSYSMNSLDELIVTLGKTLVANGVEETHGKSELITLAVTLAEKIVADGHAKIEKFTVDFFDDRWFESIYRGIYPEVELSHAEASMDTSWLEELELEENPAPEQITDEYFNGEPYDYEDFDLTVRESSPDDELEAPAAPKIRYAERAERKTLDKEKAAAEAPAWAVLKPLGPESEV